MAGSIRETWRDLLDLLVAVLEVGEFCIEIGAGKTDPPIMRGTDRGFGLEAIAPFPGALIVVPRPVLKS